MKKSLIKQIAMIGAVVVGMLAFGGTTQANASSKEHFNSRTITYHIDSTSKHYKGIWKDAIDEWNSKGVLKFKASSKKKANLRLTTVFQLKHDYFYQTRAHGTLSERGYTRIVDLKLSRNFMDENNYTQNERVNLATMGIENSLGLNLSNDKQSHMYYSGEKSITSYDVSQLKKLYAHVK